MANQDQDLVSSLKYQAALKCVREELPLFELPIELVEYCEELGYVEKMNLINSIRPVVFEEHLNNFVPDNEPCSYDCPIRKDKPCPPQHTVDLPSKGTWSVRYALRSGFIHDPTFKYTLLEFDSQNNVRLPTIWTLGIKKISICVGGCEIMTIPGEILETLVMEYNLPPGQLPILLPVNLNDFTFIPCPWHHEIFIYLECKDPSSWNCSLLITHSRHIIHPTFGGNGNDQCNIDLLTINNRNLGTGAKKIIIRNENVPNNRRFIVNNPKNTEEPIYLTIPKSRIRRNKQYTIIDVDNFTAEILTDNIWYIQRNTIIAVRGMGGIKYPISISENI